MREADGRVRGDEGGGADGAKAAVHFGGNAKGRGGASLCVRVGVGSKCALSCIFTQIDKEFRR